MASLFFECAIGSALPLERELEVGNGTRQRARDLAVTAFGGALLAPAAVVAELAAGIARRGGSIVVNARAVG